MAVIVLFINKLFCHKSVVCLSHVEFSSRLLLHKHNQRICGVQDFELATKDGKFLLQNLYIQWQIKHHLVRNFRCDEQDLHLC